jgi:hypothetical protein
MTFSDQQFEYLSQYRAKFLTATESGWVSTPSPLQLRTIAETYQLATGSREPLRTNCNHCILNLMQRVGRLFLADEVERAKAAKAAARSKKATKTTEENDTETTD